MNTALISAFIVAFIWGVQSIVLRYALKTVSQNFVLLISAITYIIAVTFYIVFWKWKDLRDEITNILSSHPHIIPMLSLNTFVGLFLTNLIYFYAIKHTSNINIVITISALYPIVALILSSIFLKESLSPIGLLGFSMVVSGIALLLYTSKQQK